MDVPGAPSKTLLTIENASAAQLTGAVWLTVTISIYMYIESCGFEYEFVIWDGWLTFGAPRQPGVAMWEDGGCGLAARWAYS